MQEERLGRLQNNCLLKIESQRNPDGMTGSHKKEQVLMHKITRAGLLQEAVLSTRA